MKIFSLPKIKIPPLKLTGFILFLIIAFSIGRASVPIRQISTQTTPPAILHQQTLNKSFSFSIQDNQGQPLSNITYTIQSADLQYDIILRGEKASTVRGKAFLIINLKLTNPSDKTIQINTRDYVRLSVNNSIDLLAPEIHNDPIQIQPISTTYTRLGYTIGEKDRNLILHIGEIGGEKTKINLKLTKGR